MTTIGVLAGSWRATVDERGAVVPDDGARLDWWVAADDRWHDPATETSVRQQRLGGTPVIETRLRVPSGDVVQRVYAVADGGGLTVVEFENDSPLPVAVALSRPDLLTSRPPTDIPIQGIELPGGAIVVPVGHHSTVRVALAHNAPAAGALPSSLPAPLAVSRGWSSQMEQASRLVTPDDSLADRLVRERCELVLNGVDDPADDPVGFLLGAGELARLGWSVTDWEAEVAGVASTIATRIAKSGAGPTWDEDRALLAATTTLARTGDRRGAQDAESVRRRLGARSSFAAVMPTGVRAIAWIEDSFVRPTADGGAVLHAAGHRRDWLGQSIEVYSMPAPGGRAVSYALRWHGERPAALWEVTGAPGLALSAGADPLWVTTAASGEALWSIPQPLQPST